MKLVLLSVLGFVFTAASAEADYRPNWDRPIEGTEMKIRVATGDYSDVRKAELVLTRRDGSKGSEAFTLVLDGKPKKFVVLKTASSCGSKVYYLSPKSSMAEYTLNRVELVVADHKTRVCKDLRPARWEAVLSAFFYSRAGDKLSNGELEMIGNPEPIFTPQITQ